MPEIHTTTIWHLLTNSVYSVYDQLRMEKIHTKSYTDLTYVEQTIAYCCGGGYLNYTSWNNFNCDSISIFEIVVYDGGRVGGRCYS